MRSILPLMGGLLIASGCVERTYEIDFSGVQGFEWDGRMRIVKGSTFQFGPFLTPRNDWRVKEIELAGREGQNAHVDASGYDDFPIAMVAPAPPMSASILGVSLLRPAIARAGPQAVSGTAESRPAETVGELPAEIPPAPVEKRPYAEHIDELTLADWWAIALRSAELVSVRFELPDEGLQIVLQGRPDRHGPAVVEIRDGEGKVLKRFERRQVEVQPIK